MIRQLLLVSIALLLTACTNNQNSPTPDLSDFGTTPQPAPSVNATETAARM